MSDKTILGRPINGDVDKRHFKPVEQWEADKLLADLDAVFAADPTVMALNWTQYTPYFNDGDPCEFGANLNDDGLVAYDKVPASWYYEEAFDEEGEPIRLGGGWGDKLGTTEWVSGKGYVEKDNPTDLDVAVDRLRENWKHYEDVVREHFGEHSKVIATRDGFNVEYYEHD